MLTMCIFNVLISKLSLPNQAHHHNDITWQWQLPFLMGCYKVSKTNITENWRICLRTFRSLLFSGVKSIGEFSSIAFL